MRLVGYNDLQARSAYQPVIHKQGNRWILYVGHHGGTRTIAKPVNPLTGQAEHNGTSIIDVTNPRRPKYLHTSPGEPGNYEQGGAQMVRVCDGATPAEGRQVRRLHAAHVRQLRARGVERRDAGEAGAGHPRQRGPQGHAQELLGVRYRHRLSRVGPRRLARARG